MERNLRLSALIKQLQTILEEKGDIAVGVECMSDDRMMWEGDLRVDPGYDDEESGEWVEETIVMITTWSLEQDRAVDSTSTAYVVDQRKASDALLGWATGRDPLGVGFHC